LWIAGNSNAELRERRDRADDAIRATQGAIAEGYLPGGGRTLVLLSKFLRENYGTDDPECAVLGKALLQPVKMLLSNVGFTPDETEEAISKISEGKNVLNVATKEWNNAYSSGVVDCVPAVLYSLRNAISISSLLGLLGGVVVFARDIELERRESQNVNNFLRETDLNLANERAF
jgi:chaperonin GroEL